jgi:hypothetical protein
VLTKANTRVQQLHANLLYLIGKRDKKKENHVVAAVERGAISCNCMEFTMQFASLFGRPIIYREQFLVQQSFSVLNQPPHVLRLVGKYLLLRGCIDVTITDEARP